MKAFVCIYCGNHSLVRSNFKLYPDRRAYCRNEIACKQRAVEHAASFADRVQDTRSCYFCHHVGPVHAFKPCGVNTFQCIDEHACGDRTVAFETQNEYRLAQNAHNADSTPPRDTAKRVARYWSGYDTPDDTTCDKVYIDRTTGHEVMRYDAADPANTNPYYGASTDGDCMRRKGLDLQETISRDQVMITDAECRSRMRTCMYDDEFGYEYDVHEYGN